MTFSFPVFLYLLFGVIFFSLYLYLWFTLISLFLVISVFCSFSALIYLFSLNLFCYIFFDFQSLNVRGLYPAGEGAGYAGGILSAGVDGIKVAEALARSVCA